MYHFIRFHKKNISIGIFLLFMFILHLIKPKLFYDEKGTFRQFGIGYSKKTIFPIWLITIVLAILSYLIVLLLGQQ